jgi:1,4-dihydroxy-6-naphthoate synthase
MSEHQDPMLLRLGHSPDPDDAFMWWPLLERDGEPARLASPRFRFEAVAEDIETLNQRSMSGELEITAMSCAQYPHVRDRYVITACGASMGEGYGPKLVAREPIDVRSLRDGDSVLAIPGERTTAFATMSLMIGPGTFRYEVVPFEQVIERVAAGEFAAGLVIHEGQLTFKEAGLHLIADVGQWWSDRYELPLPLGINTVRRDLDEIGGRGTLADITRLLLDSVRHALDHRDESIAYAMRFARDMGEETADAFVSMYVNRWTLDFGNTGRQAVKVFLAELAAAGLTPTAEPLEFIAAT